MATVDVESRHKILVVEAVASVVEPFAGEGLFEAVGNYDRFSLGQKGLVHPENEMFPASRQEKAKCALGDLSASTPINVLMDRQIENYVVCWRQQRRERAARCQIDLVELALYGSPQKNHLGDVDISFLAIDPVNEFRILFGDFVSQDAHIAAGIKDGSIAEVDAAIEQIADSIMPASNKAARSLLSGPVHSTFSELVDTTTCRECRTSFKGRASRRD